MLSVTQTAEDCTVVAVEVPAATVVWPSAFSTTWLVINMDVDIGSRMAGLDEDGDGLVRAAAVVVIGGWTTSGGPQVPPDPLLGTTLVTTLRTRENIGSQLRNACMLE